MPATRCVRRAMTDPRKGGVWGEHENAGKPWTMEEDIRLIRWGGAVDYDFVAGHDFGREPCEGSERIAWLRKHMPALVACHEAED